MSDEELRPGWVAAALVYAAAAVVTIVLMFLAWEVAERSFSSAETVPLFHYARGISTSLIAALVIGLVSLRRARLRLDEETDRVIQMGRELDSLRSLQERVLESVPTGLVVVDKERNVRLANRAAKEIHGQDLVGDVCDHVLDGGGGDRCRVCTGCETLADGNALASNRDVTVPRTGAVLSIASHPVQLTDGSQAALLVEQVVTEQRKLQASLVHQEKMAAFGLVAAGVAHEMGNPLSSIEMHLQLLDTAPLSEEDAESIQTVRRETARLRRTLRELVDFARRRRTEASSVSVETVIRDALRLIRFDRRMRNVQTKLELDRETPPVFAVEDHLMQVMVNLLINAMDAMPDGGTLRIDARSVGSQVAIRVRDDGTGMNKATLERCFEPLYTTKDSGKGTGLGLSICREVLAAAGGNIEVHSAPSRGTTVVVTLPAEEDEQLATLDTGASQANVASAPA